MKVDSISKFETLTLVYYFLHKSKIHLGFMYESKSINKMCKNQVIVGYFKINKL